MTTAIQRAQFPIVGLPGVENHVSDKRVSSTEKVSIFDAYSGKTRTQVLHPHNSVTYVGRLEESFRWDDLTVRVDSDARFQRQLAGHVETGRSTDPAIGGGVRETEEVGEHD
jgi:hypothetical protein